MGTQRKRITYILSEMGEKKIIDALIAKEIKVRNWASWLQKQTQSIGKDVGGDTIRKILRKTAVEEYAIQSVFNALHLSYKRNTDSTEVLKDTDNTSNEFTGKYTYQNLFSLDHKIHDFFGRHDDLVKLNTLINQNKKVIVIQAIGGVGKTALAKQYLYNQGFDFVLTLEMA